MARKILTLSPKCQKVFLGWCSLTFLCTRQCVCLYVVYILCKLYFFFHHFILIVRNILGFVPYHSDVKEHFSALSLEMARFISLDFGHTRVTQVLLILCEVMKRQKSSDFGWDLFCQDLDVCNFDVFI